MKIRLKSNFIIPNSDVKTGDWVMILNEGEYRKLPQQPDREVLVFKVQVPSGEVKLLNMNTTTQKEFIQAYGDDSINWIGKKGRVEIVKQRMFDKWKEVIYIHPEHKAREIPIEEITDDGIPVIEE